MLTILTTYYKSGIVVSYRKFEVQSLLHTILLLFNVLSENVVSSKDFLEIFELNQNSKIEDQYSSIQ
jgi:hypothetical protein